MLPNQSNHSEQFISSLARLILAIIVGGMTFIGVLFLFATIPVPGAQAAPVVHPQRIIITGTTSVTHTSATTHEMRVFGNGRISDRFLTDNAIKTNEIGNGFTATTIAVLFDQHPGDNVDIGTQGELTVTKPITLQTASTIPGYLEDTRAIYASQALSYQITQRTLAPSSNNCVIMEFDIQNTGSLALTGGKFLFMIDTQAGEQPTGDTGGYDPGRRLLYQTDYNTDTQNGYAVGISLLEGSLRGYGADGIEPIPNTLSDTVVKAEMITPSNETNSSPNNISWMVANIPDLSADEETKLVFSFCARSAFHPNDLIAEAMARDALFVTYGNLIDLVVLKGATPPQNSPVVVGDLLTYTIAITSSGEFYVDDIVITDQIPISTNLITYNVTQGTITASNRIVTATVGRLYPTSDTVFMNIVVSPLLSLTNGTLITNQAFINSEPIVTKTNIVTHPIATLPVLTVTKQGTAPPLAVVGAPFTYTLTVTNTGGTTATQVNVVDTLPDNAHYLSGGSLEPGDVVSLTISEIAPNGNAAQVSYVITTCQESLINNNYRVVTSTRGITTSPGVEIVSGLAPPTFDPQFVYNPSPPGINQTIFFSSTSTTNGSPIVAWDWDFGDGNLGSGSTFSHDYTEAGIYTVTLTMTDGCNYQAMVTRTVTVFLPDLIVAKQADPEPVSAGSRLTYTVTIFNQGPVEATGVVVSDTLPGNTTFVPGSVDIIPGSAGGIPGTPPIIASGLTVTANSQVTVTYQVTVTSPLTDGTLLTNTVAVSSSQIFTPTVATNTSTVTSMPELEITKFATPPSPLRPGTAITYSVVVRNNGNANATGAVISDSVPTNTSFVPGSIHLNPITAGELGSDPPALATNVLIPAGQSVTASYVVVVNKPLSTGTLITNTASVTSIQTPVPVTASVTSLISATSELNIAKLASYAIPLSPGDILTYTILVSNTGDANASGAVISDTLPDNTNFIPGSLDIEPDDAGLLGAFPTLVSDLEIAVGQRVTVTFAVTVDTPLANGTIITNTASITAPQEPLPKSSAVTATVVAMPDVEIVKTGPVSANILSTIVYTFTVSNVGNTPLQITQIVDNRVGAVTHLLSGSDTNGNNQLDLNETWAYTASYTIPMGAPALLTNTVVVTATDGLFTTVTDSDSHVTQVFYDPILAMTKTGPASAIVESSIIFTFTVRHAPGSDNSPVHVISVNDSIAGQATRINGDANNLLEGGEVWTYTANYIVNPHLASNPLVNTGTVTAQDLGGQPITAVATHSTQLSGFDPRLFIDKDGPALAEVGETVIYTFTIINVDLEAFTKFNLAREISISAVGDGSPISLTTVSDNVATNLIYVSGDFYPNNKVDGGEAWIYTASHRIEPQPDPLVNVITVIGTDLENDLITGSDTHSTNISQNPALQIVKSGSTEAVIGKSVGLTFTVSHDPNHVDKSPVSNIVVRDTVAGLATIVTGDDGDAVLEEGEQWIYRVDHFIGFFTPNPLVGTAVITGRDLDNDVISSATTYTISVTISPDIKLWYFPIISKD